MGWAIDTWSSSRARRRRVPRRRAHDCGAGAEDAAGLLGKERLLFTISSSRTAWGVFWQFRDPERGPTTPRWR
jgi:hypothetical protein